MVEEFQVEILVRILLSPSFLLGVWDFGEDVKGSLEKEKKPLSTWGFLGVKKCEDYCLTFSCMFLKIFFSLGFHIGSILCS
jgi:hypothetical protein